MFQPYKPGQAKTSRTVTFLSGVGLTVWGGQSLVLTLPRFASVLNRPLNVQFGGAAPTEGWTADLILFESPLSISLVIGAVLVLGTIVWWYRFLNKPKWADMLIDMEAELRKVSWPSYADAWQSTLVVTGCTLVLVGLLVVYDFLINRFLMLFVSGA